MTINKTLLEQNIEKRWESSIIPILCEYIKIPNKSPVFDTDWVENGHIERVVKLVKEWCLAQNLKGATVSIERMEGRTPLLFIDIEGTGKNADKTVLLYGHLDKQPEMTGWDQDKGPWKPVLINDRLYGRGAADDGYAVFSAVSVVKALQDQDVAHARCVIVVESCEEGGSHDLPFYIEQLQDRIGKPDLVFCLDTSCGNYDQLWITTSLRGSVVGNLSVELLREGIHSGNGGGIVASSFRVMRSLLDRLENAGTGEVLLNGVKTRIPYIRHEQAQKAASVLEGDFKNAFPLISGVETVSEDISELILNRAWRASLSYTGAKGFPSPEQAGNVLRPQSLLKLSLRIPPNSDSKVIATELKKLLEENPPYRAKVHYTVENRTDGWNAPDFPEWFENAVQDASTTFFGREALFIGEGGSIPFINLLSRKFPEAKFMLCGILGPNSNAHGPNEFLCIPAVKKLTCCVAQVLAQHSEN